MRTTPGRRAGPVAAVLVALLVTTGCGTADSDLPEVAGSPVAAAEPPPVPEPSVTVTASVAPEPSVPAAPAPDAPEPPEEPADAEPVQEAVPEAAAPLPEPENAADEQISFSFPGVGGTVLDAMDADGLAFEAKGSGENSFITAVGGREADDSAREYWALYVNGVYAQLGAGSQQASADDTITWRLEKY